MGCGVRGEGAAEVGGGGEFWERRVYTEAKIRSEEGGCTAGSLEELGFRFGEGEEVKGGVQSEP